MKSPTSISILLLLASCILQKTPKATYKELEFSYTNTFEDSYSMKLTLNDTIYLTRYFPWPEQTFYGILSPAQRQKIDRFITAINFHRLDTLYYNDYSDGSGYQFYVKTGSLSKKIFVHRYDNEPVELTNLAIRLVKMKTRLSLFPVDTIIHFMDNAFFNPQIPPRIKDTITFTTPKVECD